MKKGQFSQSLEAAKNFVRKAELLLKRVEKSTLHDDFLNVFYKDDIIDIYNVALDTSSYEIMFKDESILQFNATKDDQGRLSLRYAYYQFPYKAERYSDFLKNYGVDENEGWGVFLEEYQQKLIEAKADPHALVVRYDLSYSGYKSELHPVSHLHFGLRNEVRLPFERELTPLGFTCFIVKQIYPSIWAKILLNSALRKTAIQFKKSCPVLASDWHGAEDKREFYLA